MQIKDGFVLRKIAGEDVVIPLGENLDQFNGVITLNETARFLWEQLQKDCDQETLVAALIQEYDVSREKAAADVLKYVTILKDHQILQNL